MRSLEVLGIIALLLAVIAAPVVLPIHFYRVAKKNRPPRRPRSKSASSAFPVITHAVPAIPLADDGPGRYRIVGVVAATGTDTKMFIHAETLANAKVKAELRGVVVTEIVKQ